MSESTEFEFPRIFKKKEVKKNGARQERGFVSCDEVVTHRFPSTPRTLAAAPRCQQRGGAVRCGERRGRLVGFCMLSQRGKAKKQRVVF